MKKFIFAILLTIISFSGIEAQQRPSVTYHIEGKSYKENSLVSKDGIIYRATTDTSLTPPNTGWEKSSGQEQSLQSVLSIGNDANNLNIKNVDSLFTNYIKNVGKIMVGQSNPFGADFSFYTNNDTDFPTVFSINNNTTNAVSSFYGLTNVVDYEGTGDVENARGQYNRLRLQGSHVNRAIGLYNELEIEENGTDNMLLAYGFSNRVEVNGTNNQTIDFLLGVDEKIVLSNPNATYSNFYGGSIDATLSSGAVDYFTLLRLDLDQNGGTISDGAYLEFNTGIDLTQAQANDIKVIESFVDLPSVFAGTLEAKGISITGGTSDEIMLRDGSTTSLSGLSTSLEGYSETGTNGSNLSLTLGSTSSGQLTYNETINRLQINNTNLRFQTGYGPVMLNGPREAAIRADNVNTANTIYQLPDKSGTFALTSDITDLIPTNNLEFVDVNSSSYTLTEADITNSKIFLINSAQTNVTLTVPDTALEVDEIKYIFIYHLGTGNVTVQGDAGVTLGPTTIDDAKEVVLFSSVEDSWVIKDTGSGSGGLGGSIADTQIAVGNSSGEIEGSSNLTFDSNGEFTALQNRSGSFMNAAKFLNSGMSGGNYYELLLGRDNSTSFNRGQIAFRYLGNNSTSNYLSFGLRGNGDILTIDGNGLASFSDNVEVDGNQIIQGRSDFKQDIRLRGNNTTANVGIVSLSTSAGNDFIIDNGNDGSDYSFSPTALDMFGNELINFSSATAEDITAIPLNGSQQIDFGGTASSATTFTITDINIGGYAEILYNGATEPTVTGATKFPNTASFIANTDMILCIKDFNGTRKFWFVEF